MLRRGGWISLVVAVVAILASYTAGPCRGRDSAGASANATIVRAIDGDTVDVRLGDGREESTRLIGIDTPETVRPGIPVECDGPTASATMSRFDGAAVELIADGSQDNRDRYGRLLRYVVTTHGVDVGRRQVARGLAAVYVYGGVPFGRVRAYGRAAAKARDHGRGVWSACGGQFHTPAGSG